MRIVDLTHAITPDMPVYPGTDQPRLDTACDYGTDGFRETLLTLFSHTGTHMDAPRHLFPGGASLDGMDPSRFVGKGLVVDCTGLEAGDAITMDHLRAAGGEVEQAEFLLLRTGWDRYWGEPAYWEYPCIDGAVAAYLADSGKKGVGLDTIGLDPVSDTHLTHHRRVLARDDFVIVENLTGLDRVGEGLFLFAALPVKFRSCDGAPVRAVAVLDRD